MYYQIAQTVLGKPKLHGTVKLEHEKDKQLEDLLSKHNMMSLYKIFENNSITSEEIWELKDEDLKDMGFTIGGKIKYNKARNIEKAKAVEGKQSV